MLVLRKNILISINISRRIVAREKEGLQYLWDAPEGEGARPSFVEKLGLHALLHVPTGKISRFGFPAAFTPFMFHRPRNLLPKKLALGNHVPNVLGPYFSKVLVPDRPPSLCLMYSSLSHVSGNGTV